MHTHPGVTCDLCAFPVTGIRFKCAACPNFDVCAVCLGAVHDAQAGRPLHPDGHCFLCIPRPVPANAPPALQNRAAYEHGGAQCTACGAPILGWRTTCVPCRADLCEPCELLGRHPWDARHVRTRVLGCVVVSDKTPVQAVPLTPTPHQPSGVHTAPPPRFAQRLLCGALGAQRWKGATVAISPLCVAGALAALAVGAAQGTAVERALEAALGTDAAAWVNAYAREAAADPGTRLKIATSLWHTGVVRPLFVDALRALGAHCAPLAGVAPINEWVNVATEGAIQTLLSSLPPLTACVVVNAVFFQAPWTTPFEPALSRAGVFHAWSGPGACTLMFSTGPLMVARGIGCVSVALPHGTSQRFVTAVVLPDDTGPAALDAALVAPPPLSAHTRAEGDLLLPRFRAEFGPVDLGAVLMDMGLGPLFDPAAAAVGLAPIGEGITVSHVVHKVTWAVDEAGATATAATAIVPTFSAPRARPRVTVDRPFGIFLFDTVAGITMFSGRIVSV